MLYKIKKEIRQYNIVNIVKNIVTLELIYQLLYKTKKEIRQYDIVNIVKIS